MDEVAVFGLTAGSEDSEMRLLGVPDAEAGAADRNPARSFGPDLALGNFSSWSVYLAGPVTGAVIAVGVAYVLRGPAKIQEASAAIGTPLDRSA